MVAKDYAKLPAYCYNLTDIICEMYCNLNNQESPTKVLLEEYTVREPCGFIHINKS